MELNSDTTPSQTGDPASDNAPLEPADNASASTVEQEPVNLVAKAGTYYRVTHLLMGVLLIGFGGWCAMDGFVNWPRANARAVVLKKEIEQLRVDNNTTGLLDKQEELKKTPIHTDWDLLLQRFLAGALPVGGVVMLIWTLYNSRGAYKLEGDVLTIPGHPAMKLGDVTSINRTRWERKGIAYVQYAVDGVSGRFRLDDFVYERDATDAIYDQILGRLGTSPEPQHAVALPASARAKDEGESPSPTA